MRETIYASGVTVTNDQGIELGAQRLAEWLGSRDVQLVDIREEHEYAAGHIAGSRHIEFDQVQASSESFDREAPLVFICRGGNRSGMVAEAFRTGGYDAFHIEGGLLAWTAEGLPLEPEDGEVVER